MTAGTANKVSLYLYVEPSVLTHRSSCGDYTHTHTHAHELHARNTHTNTCTHARTHATLTRTHAATHARNTHTHTRTHACTHQYTTQPTHTLALNLHVHAHTSGPNRHIHNQVIPAHGFEPCRACVNLCLSDLLPMRTDRWDP